MWNSGEPNNCCGGEDCALMYSSSLKLNDDSCSKRYGYICQATGSTCVSCPPHSSSPLESTSLSACKCDPGFTGPNGGPCSQCTAGTYKSSFGDSACDSCPLDSMSPVGSDSASDCVCSGGFQGPTTPIVDNGGSGCTSDNQCSACQGDCDSDSDCQPGLKCWQRSQPDQTVPGCAKTGYVQSHDYCYDPTLECASWCRGHLQGKNTMRWLALALSLSFSPPFCLLSLTHTRSRGRKRDVETACAYVGARGTEYKRKRAEAGKPGAADSGWWAARYGS